MLLCKNGGGGGQKKENSTVEQHWRISLIDVTRVFAFVKDLASNKENIAVRHNLHRLQLFH